MLALTDLIGPKDQRDAPDARQGYDGVDDAGKERFRATAKPSHRVKSEQPDRAPVQGTDNGKDQSDPVQDHHAFLPRFRERETLPVHSVSRSACLQTRK